jgi:hypothetical protein
MEPIAPFAFDFNLGHIPREPKATDYPVEAILGMASPTPAVWQPSDALNVPITMQNKEPACGGYAVQYSLVLKLYRQLVAAGKAGEYQPLSSRSAYAVEKFIDGFGLNTAGTTIEAVAKVRVLWGICTELLFPSDVTLDPVTFGSYNLMSDQAKADAIARATKESYFFLGNKPSLQTIKDAIYNFGDVILELQVGDEWWTALDGTVSWNAADILLPSLRPPKTVVSSHFVDAMAFDESSISFPNEWSKAWGNNGWGNFQKNYVPYIVNGVAFKAVPPSVKTVLVPHPVEQIITPHQVSIVQQILQDIKQVLGLMSQEIGKP